MELRSTGSRSRTPVVRTSIDKEIYEDKNHIGLEKTVVRTTRSTTVKTMTVSSDSDDITNITHSLEAGSVKPQQLKNSKSEKSVRKTRYKTSDYSSEEGDQQVSSTHTVDQNSTNQFLEDARRSVSRSSGSHVSALDFYRAAGDYWNKFPKTDYTYSPHSKDRTEIAPGVVAMPNMSRRSLHNYDISTDYVAHKQTNTDSFEEEEVDYSTKIDYSSKLTSSAENFIRSRPRALFANNNYYGDKYKYSVSSRASSVKKKTFISRVTSVITSIFVTVFTWISSLAYYVYSTQNAGFMWIGKKIHKATTRLMLWDTWLLKSSSSKRKLSSLLALCLIPLVLLGGWWLLSGLGPLLYGTFFNSSSPLSASSWRVATTTEINDNNVIDYSYPNSETENVQTSSKSTHTADEKLITIREKVILEPPKAAEVAAKLTAEQLRIIADSVRHSLNIENHYDTDTVIKRILESPSMQNIISNYNRLTINLKEKGSDNKIVDEEILQSQQAVIDGLRDEISKVKLELQQIEKSRGDEIAKIVAQMRTENAQITARLTYQLSRCCRNSFIHMEGYITRILKDLLGAPHYLSTSKDISDWLHSTFIAKQDLETHLANLTQHLKSDYDVLIANNGKLIMDKVMSKITAELNSRLERAQADVQSQKVVGEIKIDSLTDEHIKKIVRGVLSVYDADKTGLVDYALESAGGQILSTRCTESYQARTAVVSVFGVPLWYPSNTPRTVITPGMTPGECWAFQNFPGFLLIKLAAPVKIEAFSLEHISKMLAPNGKIDSAPKEFSVYGLRNETDKEPVLLGRYTYDYDGSPLQYFAAAVHGLVFDIIELRIHSNHGNPNYTCLYRFRVHGSLSAEPT